MWRRAGCVAVLSLALLAACTDDDTDPPKADPSPPPWVTETLPAAPSTTRPLVLAVNARRPPLEPAGRLRSTDRTDRLDHLPMDTVAVVVADAVGPAVRVATVGGVDPLRDPAAYPLQGPGSRARAGHDHDRRRRHHARPRRDRTPGAGADVGPARVRRHHRRQPGEHARAARSAEPGPGRPVPRPARGAPGPAAGRLRRDRPGQQPHRRLRRRVTRADDRAAARQRPADLRCRSRPRGGAGAGRPRAARGALRVPRLQRDRGDGRGRADVVVVLPHWGEQYTHRPEPVQHDVARALARAGADLVVGGHPHWVQGADEVGDALVVHSLGNFVFDIDLMTQTMEGVVLEATFWEFSSLGTPD